jgi:hypothetical protein
MRSAAKVKRGAIHAVLGALLVMSLPSLQTSAWAGVETACRADYLKYCPTVVPGGGRIAKCLSKNRQRLSISCGAALDAGLSCEPDIRKFCSKVSSPDQLRGCLEARMSELSDGCQKALPSL